MNRRLPLLLSAAAALAGCAVGPNYVRPSAPISPTYKEAAGWTPAAPGDLLERGDWWTLFGDPVLNDLAAKVQVSNQNIVAAEAAYREARAAVSEQRAALFPTVSLNGSATRSGSGSGGGTTTVVGGDVVSGGGSRTTYRASLGGTWEPDVWGRIRRSIEAAKDQAQASAADLAAARLSAQGEMATDYFGLRAADIELALDQASVTAYQRALTITQNRYKAGIAPHSDVLQAQTQLANAQADLAGVRQTRATYEHAIAVLTGQAPGSFSLAPVANWSGHAPDIPPGVPSTLLQRRPDIAAAERRVAAANAQIGVQVSAYFPAITLSGSYGFASSELGNLFSASNAVWSYGVSAAETLLDFGARRARVRQAKAAHDQAVAQYRQTVLTALQDVEDQLIATRVLAEQEALRRQASAAADATEQMMANRYQAGQVAYTDVVTTQAAAYSARRALAQATAQRQSTAVALIQALGGGWSGLSSPSPPRPASPAG
jgi:NodT family efflux transporter outer membrane factor (OMF) lipoprotein